MFHCFNVKIEDIKVFRQWRYNADGIDIVNPQNINIENSFIHSDGSAVLYTENEKIQMQKCTLYNIPKGEWHHITVSENATVMVAENSDTSRDNTEKKLLK